MESIQCKIQTKPPQALLENVCVNTCVLDKSRSCCPATSPLLHGGRLQPSHTHSFSFSLIGGDASGMDGRTLV